MGFLYRIILSRSLGQEGLGIYQIGLSVFHVLITLVCSGIPITVSRLISKYRTEKNERAKFSLISAALILSVAMSLPLALILFFGHNALSFLFSDQRCMFIFLIMLPSLVFASVYSVIRGVFWGEKQFVPYSLVELVEEVAMIIIGIILVRKMTDAFDGAKRAAIALMSAYIISFLTAAIVFFVKSERLSSPKGFFKPLIVSAAPITATKTASSLVNSLIAIILPMRLIASGLTKSEALSAFGMAFGMAVPVLFIPATLVGSLAVVLVPELAENFYKKHSATLKRNVERAIKFSVTIACIIAPVLYVCGEEIGLIVFNSLQSGKYISRVSVILVPMSLSMMTTSMLNSIQLEKQAFIYYLCGATLMLSAIIILPKFTGAYALGIGLFISFSVMTLLNLRLLKKKSRLPLRYKRFTAFSVLFMLPACAIGKLTKPLINIYISALPATIILALLVLAISISLYVIFDMIDFLEIKKHFKKG